jgi:16S rRNA (guanine1207-N2)-methyltransferase
MLDTLLLPFATGTLASPPASAGRILFMRARAGVALRALAGMLVCEQSFKPFADALSKAGYPLVQGNGGEEGGDGETFPLVLALPPRQREEARAMLARACRRVIPGGLLVASMQNNEGARTGEADLERLAGSVQSMSKNKCRVFWATLKPEALNRVLIEEWLVLDAPRPIADGRFLSRPGVFAWSRIDAASALLARCLPADLAGRGADLGAGFGYLSAEVLVHCPGVTALDLYEAEMRALELARCNLRHHAKGLELNFLWHDVATGLLQPRHYDFIVSNPPFHQGRADQPELGRAFIEAAAAALQRGGRFWLVANRHLPYEDALAKSFKKMRKVCEEQGFKVIEAIK